MLDGTLPGYWDNKTTSFSNASSTVAKILVDVSPSLLLTALTGETAVPAPGVAETGVRQNILRGGQRIVDGVITSNDTSARNLLLYAGVQMTLYAAAGAGAYLVQNTAMGVAATTATTNSTVTRTTGSFITEGWVAGDLVMLFGAVSAANNGKVSVVTTVAALTLTVSGVSEISVAETQGAGFRLVRVSQLANKALAITQGTDGTTSAIGLLAGITPSDANPPGMLLGQSGMLIAAMSVAVTATKKVDVTANVGLY